MTPRIPDTLESQPLEPEAPQVAPRVLSTAELLLARYRELQKTSPGFDRDASPKPGGRQNYRRAKAMRRRRERS